VKIAELLPFRSIQLNFDPAPGSTPPATIPHNRFESDFKIKGVIGAGRFGRVVRCLNRLDQLQYAVKITNLAPSSNQIFAASYLLGINSHSDVLSEVYALAALNASGDTQNIVRYYYGWVQDNQLFIVVRLSYLMHYQMELCKQSLARFLKKQQKQNKLEEEKIRTIMKDICAGLDQLHAKKIAHLDIKPENLLLSFSGTYKLADLGMARLLKGDAHFPEGEKRYLAKELIGSDSIEDVTKADIFSFGALLYEIIEGVSLPMEGEGWTSFREAPPSFSENSNSVYSRELLQMV